MNELRSVGAASPTPLFPNRNRRLMVRTFLASAAAAFLLFSSACTRVEDPDPARTDFLARIMMCEENRCDSTDHLLATALADSGQDPALRARAALAAGRIGNPAFAPALRNLLEAQETQLRATALFSLGEILDPSNAHAWRWEAPGSLIRAIQDRLKDPSAEVRARAIEALAKFGNPRLLPDFEKLVPAPSQLDEEPLQLLAHEWLKAAFRLKMRHLAPQVAQYLESPEATTAFTALTRMANLKSSPEQRIPVDPALVARLLSSPRPEIRAGAVRIAPILTRPLPCSQTGALLRDSDSAVRTACAASLEYYRNGEPVHLLSAFIEEGLRAGIRREDTTNAHRLKEIQTAINSYGATAHGPAAMAFLRHCMGLSDYIAPHCAAAILRIDPAADLAADFQSHPPQQMISALHWAEAIAQSKSESCREWVRRALEGQSNPGWQTAWNQAVLPTLADSYLRSADGQPLFDRIRRFLQDNNPTMRAAAIGVLAEKPESVPSDLQNAVCESLERHSASTNPDPDQAALPILAVMGARPRPQPAKAESAPPTLPDSTPAPQVEPASVNADATAQEPRIPETSTIGRSRNLLRRILTHSPFGYLRMNAAGVLWDLGERNAFARLKPVHTADISLYRGIVRRWDAPLTVTVRTTKGPIILRLFREEAPLTSVNFLELAGRRFYDGLTFHRVVPNFVAQGGCPEGNGSGGPGTAIPCEINTRPYHRGTLGMALSGKDTGGSQFFITLADTPHLEGGYTVFGEVIGGMDVADNLLEGDRILDITTMWWDFSRAERFDVKRY